jgi:hypothetical protein
MISFVPWRKSRFGFLSESPSLSSQRSSFSQACILRSKTRTVRDVNALLVIFPYKYQGTWVFDDQAVDLFREPFIAGIDTMIDKAVADIPNAEKGFRAIFSASPFPGANWKLEWRREESGGNWYYSNRFKMEGWLCPALLKYFPTAPREIYVKIEQINP